MVDDVGVQQFGLEPTPEDPKLWMVTVKQGHEREVALQLLQKSLHMYNMATPLAIKSVVALDHLKGFVYVEADKEAHVSAGATGARGGRRASRGQEGACTSQGKGRDQDCLLLASIPAHCRCTRPHLQAICISAQIHPPT